MAVLTADQFAQQIIAQARLLDPSLSLEVGTPERKIVDAIAQALADNQIDLTGLQGALDIDSKFGSNLDQFTAMFGMERQQPAAATGFVVFSRLIPAPALITIPSGTVVQASVTPDAFGPPMQYITTASGTVAVGDIASSYIPIQAISTGTSGNVVANTITQMVGTPPPGVTAVSNPAPLTNGFGMESDDIFKVRFKNTWARNLAGTAGQYLALAVSSPYTTKANAVGLVSRFQEYIQVPSFDDSGHLKGGFPGGSVWQNTLGTQGKWTTAVSTIPYAQDIYTNLSSFISNGQSGVTQFYYRSGVDFLFNYPALDSGDAVREVATNVVGSPQTGPGPINVVSTDGFPSSGHLVANDPDPIVIQYTGITATSFTGCVNADSPGASFTVNADVPLYLRITNFGVRPNFSFFNVYNPASPTTIAGLKALSPGDVVLSEFSYLSQASRNDLAHNVNNAVDVYVDGSNPTQASSIFLSDLLPDQQFTINPNSPYYYENYRRDGAPTKRPQANNLITPLFQTPLTSLPPSITISGQTYYHNAHYWLVHEIGDLGGSVRARDAIEWDNQLGGDHTSVGRPVLQTDATNTDAIIGPQVKPYTYTGDAYSAITPHTPVEVNRYGFDANVLTLQAAIENTAARQITTDALVHKATTRYFKLDITVMYTVNANPAVVNAAIAAAVQAYFDRQYFGSVIQLSTLLEIIHNTSGVDNVRWSNDLPIIPDLIRVYETDIYGMPVHGTSVDRLVLGTNSSRETQTLYIVGRPKGSFTLKWSDPANTDTFTTAPIPFTDTGGGPVHDSTIEYWIQLAAGIASADTIYGGILVSEDIRPTTAVPNPIRSFTLTYGANGKPYLPSVITQDITASDYAFDNDYFLLDNELPSLPQFAVTGDTLPGLIIRPRAQSTFYRPGLT